MADPEKDLSGVAKAYQAAGPWMGAASRLTGGAVAGVVGGLIFDSVRHSTEHWGVLVGSFLGITVGFIGFITSIMKLNKKS